MTNKFSWEVVAVGLDDDAEHDDCRQITDIAYLAPSLTTAKIDVIASKINSGYTPYHLETPGGRVELQVAKDQRNYVRTAAEDTPDDPLLALPTIEEYKESQRFANV